MPKETVGLSAIAVKAEMAGPDAVYFPMQNEANM
jgi:hypothetical protein